MFTTSATILNWIQLELLVLLVSPCWGAGTYYVSGPTDPFTIAQAIAAANDGDVIKIAAGTYWMRQCDLQLANKNNVTLLGVQGSQNTIVDCSGTGKRCISFVGVSETAVIGIQFRGCSEDVSVSAANGIFARKSRRLLPRRRRMEKAVYLGFTVHFQLYPNGNIAPRLVLRRKTLFKSPHVSNKRSSLSNNASFSGNVVVYQSQNVRFQDVVIQGSQGLARALWVQESNVTLVRCQIVGNNGGGGGGSFKNSIVVLANSIIADNVLATESDTMAGGGCSFDGCTEVMLVNNTVHSNHVFASSILNPSRLMGGGLSFVSCTRIQFAGSTVIEFNSIRCLSGGSNMVVQGGGLSISQSSQISMTGSVLVQGNFLNSASPDLSYSLIQGGGMGLSYVVNVQIAATTTVFNNSVFSSNGAYYVQGAGVFVSYFDAVTMIGPMSCTFNVGKCSDSTAFVLGGGLEFFNGTRANLVGPVTLAFNSIVGVNSGDGQGGGLYIYNVDIMTMRGPLDALNNTIVSRYSNGNYIQGAGLYLLYCYHSDIKGSITVAYNSIVFVSYALKSYSVMGAGVHIDTSTDMSILGDLYIHSNSLQSSVAPYSTDEVYLPPPRTSNRTHCGQTTITSTAGTLNDGSGAAGYSQGIHCSWLVQPFKVLQAFTALNVTFSMFQTNQDWDFISIFDGDSTTSPLIGQYSGSFDSFSCVLGPCPALNSSIVTSGGQMLVRFDVDPASTRLLGGFNLVWNSVTVNRTSDPANNMMLRDPQMYPSYAAGGGLSIYGTDITINSLQLKDNAVSNPFLALGAGIFVQFSTSAVILTNASVVGNRAFGGIHAAGAISVVGAASLTCNHCTLDGNQATAQNFACFYSSGDGSVLCPAVFGSSLLLSSAAQLVIGQNTVVSRGLGVCDTGSQVQCNIYGGAIAVIHDKTFLTFRQSSCSACEPKCSSQSFCPWMAGGCMYIHKASVAVSQSLFVNNTVNGIGNGGAISASSTSVSSVVDSAFVTNTARQGGAVGISSAAIVRMQRCTFTRNFANSVAGAIVVTDDAPLYVVNSTFDSNTAARASVIFSFNNNNKAKYTALGIEVTVPVGSAALMLGSLNLSSSNIWRCSQPGTVFALDYTMEFFSLSCIVCGQGTYAVDAASSLAINRTCLSCPFGASCEGSSPSSNGLMALGGYFGVVNPSTGTASFYSCPAAYCCPSTQTCSYAYCQGSRTGILCGQCPVGQGLRFFTESCGDDSSCNDGNWAAVLILVFAAVVVTSLVKTTGNQSSGMLSVLLFFYQVLPLVKSTPWKHVSDTVLVLIQSIFSFSPSSQDSNSKGICIAKSMTTAQKLWIRMAILGVVFGMFPVAFLVQYAAAHRERRRMQMPKLSHYIATAVRFLTIAYTTLVLLPLQMIQCVTVDNKNVWWWDASIECYTASWQIAGLVFMAVLFPLPLIVILMLLWKKASDLQQEWARSVWKVLTNGFKDSRRWWLGVSLYRRLLLVLSYTMIIDQNWRAATAAILCILFVALSFTAQPYQDPNTQRFEMGSLIAMSFIAATTAPQLSQIAFATSSDIPNGAALERLQVSLCLAPIVLFVLYNILTTCRRFKLQRMFSSSSNNNNKTAISDWESGIPDCPVCSSSLDFNQGTLCDLHQFC